MASHKMNGTKSSRLGYQPDAPQRNLSSQLPVRGHSGIPPQRGIPVLSSTSRLSKKPSNRNKDALPTSMLGRAMSKPTMSSLASLDPSKSANLASVTSTTRIVIKEPPFDPLRAPPPKLTRLDSNRTPSLVSGSSASTMDSPQSVNPRRRPQVPGARSESRSSPSESMSSHEEAASSTTLTRSGFDGLLSHGSLDVGVASANGSAMGKADDHEVIQLDQYIPQMPPPMDGRNLTTPVYATTATPSTGYSPGPFSISSTPTSMSSYSPSTVLSYAPTGSVVSARGFSPLNTRSPFDRSRSIPIELINTSRTTAAVRESSSSSTSTIKAGDGATHSKGKHIGQPVSKLAERSVRKSLMRPPQQAGSETAPPPKAYPEFAHLNDVSPRKGSLPSSVPARPSREGAPTIQLKQTSPVIQSNMSSLPHKRTNSAELKRAVVAGLNLDTMPRFPMHKSNRLPSPSPSQLSVVSPMSSRPPTRGTTPEVPAEGDKASRIKATPPTSSKPFSRFGLFSRKGKTDASPTLLTKEKPVRKGPAAGTGHEGYGKFGVRGRSGSTTSGSGTSVESTPKSLTHQPSSRKNSVDSNADAEDDDFVSDRLAPVTLRGTGNNLPFIGRSQSETTLTSLTSKANRGLGASTISSGNGGSLQSGLTKRPALLPSPMSDPTIEVSQLKRQATVAGSKEAAEKVGRFGLPTLASRRVSRMSMMPDKPLMPASDETVPRKNSEPTITLSRGLGSSTDLTEGKEGTWLRPRKSETVPKPGLSKSTSRRWNFFQKSKAPAAPAAGPIEEVPPVPALRPLPPRAVAHYALIDAPRKRIDMEELEQIMLEADQTPDLPDNPATDTDQPPRATEQEHPVRVNTLLLPEPPKLDTSFAVPANPQIALPLIEAAGEKTDEAMSPVDGELMTTVLLANSPTMTRDVSPPRIKQSRLPRVGRIPPVISSRERQKEHSRKISDASFSRPFPPTQPSPALRNSIDNADDLEFSGSPDLHMGSTPALQHEYRFAPASVNNASPSLSNPAHHSTATEFEIDASDCASTCSRKQSEASSESCNSGLLNIATSVAMLPAGEDDVWGEYDDFLDALSPRTPKTPKSAVSTSSSLGAPFHYMYLTTPPLPATKSPIEGPITEEAIPGQQSVPRMMTIAENLRIPSTTGSRLLSTIPPLMTPTSPFSISDILSGYGETRLSVVDRSSGRLSLPSNGRFSTSSNRHSVPAPGHRRSTSATTSIPWRSSGVIASPRAGSGRRDSRLIEHAEKKHMGFQSMANLRFGALMISKWLSFGRVLFSPVHLELKDPANDRVLVLDGLGKDWSYYVALTYPTASIYNLGPEPVDAPPKSPNPTMQSLPNHRHICHPSLSSPFPFPKGFFAAVVFRFPVATSEAAYRIAVSESKRVLRPGGYLELSVLDIDMLNMGNCGRRAVRQLKMGMQEEDTNTSLKPLSDTMQKLLGRRGFENLNRCIVGVPAAGRMPIGSGTHTPSVQPLTTDKSTCSPFATELSQPSFSDLLRDQSSAGEEGITMMVAKVARWWYSRCYESVALPDADPSRSIWSDEALLAECEQRGTSLRLMVAFAQKPECQVRRTISV